MYTSQTHLKMRLDCHHASTQSKSTVFRGIIFSLRIGVLEKRSTIDAVIVAVCIVDDGMSQDHLLKWS